MGLYRHFKQIFTNLYRHFRQINANLYRHFWKVLQKLYLCDLKFIIKFCDDTKKSNTIFIGMESAPHDIAVRVWSQPFSVDEVITKNGKKFKLVNLPFYYVVLIERVLSTI